MGPKAILGMTIILIGIVWITISKASPSSNVSSGLTEDEITINRIICVSLAIFLALMSSMRSLQAKYIYRKTGYPGT